MSSVATRTPGARTREQHRPYARLRASWMPFLTGDPDLGLHAVALLVAHSPDSDLPATAPKRQNRHICRDSFKRAREDSNLWPSVP